MHRFRFHLPQSLSTALFLFVATVVAALTTRASDCAAQDIVKGVWEGTYKCGEGYTGLELSIFLTNDWRVAGRVKFFPIAESTHKHAGEFATYGRFRRTTRGNIILLGSGKWIVEARGYRPFSLEGQLDASGNSISGRVPRCGEFQVRRTGRPVPQEIIAENTPPVREKRRPQVAAVPKQQNQLPPELQTQPVRVRDPGRMGPMMIQQPYEFGYMDAVMAKRVEAELGVEPIEELNQWLFKSGLKCISSRSLSVGPSDFGANAFATKHFGNKVYVVHCSGKCESLRYQLTTRHTLWHFGLAKPYPVLRVNSMDLSTGDIKFAFSHPQGGAQVTVSQWSGDPGDYGGGCTDTMFQQK